MVENDTGRDWGNLRTQLGITVPDNKHKQRIASLVIQKIQDYRETGDVEGCWKAISSELHHYNTSRFPRTLDNLRAFDAPSNLEDILRFIQKQWR
jgi:hypothetical protein